MKDPSILKKFIKAEPDLILKEVRADCQKRSVFNALIKLMCRAKSLKLTNADCSGHELYLGHLTSLHIDRAIANHITYPASLSSPKVATTSGITTDNVLISSFTLNMTRDLQLEKWRPVIERVTSLHISVTRKLVY